MRSLQFISKGCKRLREKSYRFPESCTVLRNAKLRRGQSFRLHSSYMIHNVLHQRDQNFLLEDTLTLSVILPSYKPQITIWGSIWNFLGQGKLIRETWVEQQNDNSEVNIFFSELRYRFEREWVDSCLEQSRFWQAMLNRFVYASSRLTMKRICRKVACVLLEFFSGWCKVCSKSITNFEFLRVAFILISIFLWSYVNTDVSSLSRQARPFWTFTHIMTAALLLSVFHRLRV